MYRCNIIQHDPDILNILQDCHAIVRVALFPLNYLN